MLKSAVFSIHLQGYMQHFSIKRKPLKPTEIPLSNFNKLRKNSLTAETRPKSPILLLLLHYCNSAWMLVVATDLLCLCSQSSYSNILFVSELTSLESRCDQLSRSFFQDITHPSSSLYHLFPPPRDTSVLSRLRTVTRFARPVSRTNNIAPLLITP